MGLINRLSSEWSPEFFPFTDALCGVFGRQTTVPHDCRDSLIVLAVSLAHRSENISMFYLDFGGFGGSPILEIIHSYSRRMCAFSRGIPFRGMKAAMTRPFHLYKLPLVGSMLQLSAWLFSERILRGDVNPVAVVQNE